MLQQQIKESLDSLLLQQQIKDGLDNLGLDGDCDACRELFLLGKTERPHVCPSNGISGVLRRILANTAMCRECTNNHPSELKNDLDYVYAWLHERDRR